MTSCILELVGFFRGLFDESSKNGLVFHLPGMRPSSVGYRPICTTIHDKLQLGRFLCDCDLVIGG